MINNVNNFRLNSELATLKNDTSSTVFSITIPSGLVFNPSTSYVIATQTINVGRINAGVRAVGRSTKRAGNAIGVAFLSNITCNITGVGISDVTLYCKLVRIDATSLQMQIAVEDFANAVNHTTTESATYGFTVSTFLSPKD